MRPGQTARSWLLAKLARARHDGESGWDFAAGRTTKAPGYLDDVLDGTSAKLFPGCRCRNPACGAIRNPKAAVPAVEPLPDRPQWNRQLRHDDLQDRSGGIGPRHNDRMTLGLGQVRSARRSVRGRRRNRDDQLGRP